MTDQYIGIDLHKAFFQACALTPNGERLWEDRFPRTPAGVEALTARCTPRSALAVEASTPSWHFADALAGLVGELRIVVPTNPALLGSKFHNQAVVLDPGINALGLAASNGGVAELSR